VLRGTYFCPCLDLNEFSSHPPTFISLTSNLLSYRNIIWFFLPFVSTTILWAFLFAPIHSTRIYPHLIPTEITLSCSMSMGWDDVSGLRSPTGFCPPLRWNISVESNSGMILTGKNLESQKKAMPVSLHPPQIPHGLIRARTSSSAVSGRRLTVWTMGRPRHKY
jgi:hypothetical protein